MRKRPKGNPAKLPWDRFFGKWYPKWEDGFASESGAASQYNNAVSQLGVSAEKHGAEFWDEVRDWWPVALLREVAKEGDAENYKRLLAYFLLHLRIKPPEGVLQRFKWPVGRPGETETKIVVDAWESIGPPRRLDKQTTEQIAKIAYPMEWEQSKAEKSQARNAEQKKLRDRVRATILRHDKTATKPPTLS
jgi:hypothetical protein